MCAQQALPIADDGRDVRRDANCVLEAACKPVWRICTGRRSITSRDPKRTREKILIIIHKRSWPSSAYERIFQIRLSEFASWRLVTHEARFPARARIAHNSVAERGLLLSRPMTSVEPLAGKMEFLEVASSLGVVDVVALSTDTLYVFVRSAVRPSRAKEIRELVAEWWDIPRVFMSVRSDQVFTAVREPHAKRDSDTPPSSPIDKVG
jgi:hypothetical protein